MCITRTNVVRIKIMKIINNVLITNSFLLAPMATLQHVCQWAWTTMPLHILQHASIMMVQHVSQHALMAILGACVS